MWTIWQIILFSTNRSFDYTKNMKLEGKEEIRRTALDIISYDSIENLTMSTLAERLGINKSSLYHYYKSKEEIIDEIYIEGHRRIMRKGFLLNLSGSVEDVLKEASKKWEDLFLDEDLAPFLRMIFSLYMTDERAKDEHTALLLMLKSQSDVIIGSFSKKAIQDNIEILSSLFSSLLLINLEKILDEEESKLDQEIASFANLLNSI